MKMKRHSFNFVILLTCLTVVSCEFYSSIHELEKLVDYEQLLLSKMEKFVALNENKLDYLKQKLSELEYNREDALKDGTEAFIKNPINTFLLVKRLAKDWEKVTNLSSFETDSGLRSLKNTDEVKSSNYALPAEDDYNGAKESILRLQQHIYRSNSNDVAEEILGGINNNAELSAKDCFDFGRLELSHNNLLAAHAWLSEAWERYKINDEVTKMDASLEKTEVLVLLAEAKHKLGDLRGAAEISHELKLKEWYNNDSRIQELHSNLTQDQLTQISEEIEDEHTSVEFPTCRVDEDYKLL